MKVHNKVRTATEQEYLALENSTEESTEFYNRSVYFMQRGRSINYGRMKMNLSGLVYNNLENNAFEAFSGPLVRLHVQSNSLFTYPSFLILHNPIHFYTEEPSMTVLNPVVIMDIYPEIDENYEPGEKLELFKEIKTLRHYITIDSTQLYSAVSHTLNDQGIWESTALSGPDQSIYLGSVDLRISLYDIYKHWN